MAKRIEVPVQEPAFSLVEHIERFGLVRFTAATAFISIALASLAVPPVCCAKAADENIKTAADAAAIASARIMAFLLGWQRGAEISNRHSPDDSLTEGEPAPLANF